MSNEDEDVPAHRWFYADTRTLEGALQRGRGVGALRALKDPQQAAEAVYACIRRDHRWDWQIDERGTYLARLVRDLGLDTAPITAQLWSTDRVAPEEDDHAFELTVGVLTRLARVGYGGAEAELLRYLREGERWTYVIEALAAGWPVERWDGLRDPALARLARPAAEREDLFAWREPWQRWQPEGIPPWAGPRPRPRPYRETEDPGLLAALTDPALSPASKGEALFELARRPPRPELLELAPSLTTGKPPRPLTGLRRAIFAQGALALPQARLWSADPGSPLRGLGLSVVADRGTEQDVPLLMAGWRRLQRADAWCGYTHLADGLARQGAAASCALPALRGLLRWTPHSYERAHALRAWLAIDRRDSERTLWQGLWDCESDVRLIAVQQVPLVPPTRRRLAELREDPLEDAEVRAAATARLGGAPAGEPGAAGERAAVGAVPPVRLREP
ncbi:hypothetical protein [Streptacidiphilus albus]|uniref:hypothetical protein n=1 Tax=Streptacidiphilus albus TaxID=105425 RepID=UPI00068C2784|nr:hypothetical protein [Streptacidiphilus albus]